MSTSPINAGNGTPPNTYEVDPHDTLTEIAAENNMSLQELLELNPQFDGTKVDGKLDTARNGNSGWDPDFIRPGDTIILRKTEGSGGADPTGATGTSGGTGGGGVEPVSWTGKTTPISNPTTEQGRINEAMRYFKSQGWSEAQAAGIVANLQAESHLRPRSEGDSGLAYGIGQWHPDRQDNFKSFAGHSIQTSTFSEQLRFVQWELTHTEKEAASALTGADSAREAAAIFCRLYERPADITGQSQYRGTLAQNIVGGNSETMYA